MDKKAAVEKILKATQAQGGNMFSNTSGPSWMAMPNTLQPQVNKAIDAWLNQNDPEPLKGIVSLLQTTGALNDKETDELLAAIEEKE